MGIRNDYLSILHHCLVVYGAILDEDGNPIKYELDEETWLFYIGMVEQRILNYTNLKEIPISHYYTWAMLTVDVVRNWVETTFPALVKEVVEEDDLSSKTVKSIKEGDVTVAFGYKYVAKDNQDVLKNFAAKAHIGELDKFMFNYMNDLNSIRRMKWV